MPSCDIIFALPMNVHFSWIKGCEGVDKSDLKALTAVCSYALASLQNELSNQQDSTANSILKDCDKLQQSAKRIQQEGLNFDEKERLKSSADPIAAITQGLKLHPKSRNGWQKDAYNELLWLVSTFVSPAHALLFLCVISESRVKNLTAEGRAKLVQYIKRNEYSLLCSIFQSKATELGLCNDDVDAGSQLASKKRKNDNSVANGSQARSPLFHQPPSQGLPSPISITSPPVQGVPEHQQPQEKHHNGRASSPTQQCIPTPTSNASPSRPTPSNGLGVMLSRAISPQPQWSEQGVFCQVKPHDAGLHRTLATKISGDRPPEQLQVALAHQKSTLLRNGFISDRSRVSHSPSPPQALLISEKLFYNIKVYFENTCRNINLDHRGTLLNPNGAKLYNDLCDFDSYCFTATMLKEKGLHVEFRRALSKAFALIEQILRAEHPRTLACFLEVFIHLRQTGLPDVTSRLRDFIKEMSVQVTQTEHPWGQICQLLGELGSESLDQAMAQAWKCTIDTFDTELGTLTPLTVSVRLDYIKRVYWITNHREEEWHLRGLLAQFGDIPSLPTPRVMLNLAHNLNRQGRHDEAEKIAREVFSLLQEYEIYAGRIVERIESLKIVSRSQFNQGNRAAEQTIREAIRMIIDKWGIQHSWVPEFKNVLEGWLRGWGREEDANTLRGEIEELMGKDEIDE